MSERTDTFTSALQELDSSGSPSALVATFADDASLVRPELDHGGAGDGTSSERSDVDGFWTDYREQFDQIETEFTHVDEAEQLAVLEWRSTGTLAAGRSVAYAGVSVLTFDEQDKVARFATYYDTAAFVRPTAAEQREGS